MLPEDFTFHRPRSVQEAVDLLADDEDQRTLLGGGMSLMPLIHLGQRSPRALVSLAGVTELTGIELVSDVLRIGSARTHAQLATDPTVRSTAPVLADAAGLIADPQVRNRGTIGGSLAQAHPGGEYLTVLSALDAQVQVRSSEASRTVAVRDLVVDRHRTVLTPAELITEVLVPVRRSGERAAYLRFSRVQGNYSTVNVAVVVRYDETLTLAIGGALTRPVVVESRLGDDLARAARAATATAFDDHMATAAYRTAMAGVLANRVLASALTSTPEPCTR